MATIQLQGVGKIYPGGVRAVQGVDLQIAHGEFVVLGRLGLGRPRGGLAGQDRALRAPGEPGSPCLRQRYHGRPSRDRVE